MRRFALLLILVLALCGCSRKGKPNPEFHNVPIDTSAGWMLYSNAKGRYTALLPGKPTEIVQQIPTDGGQIPLHISTLEDPTKGFLVNYLDFPTAEVETEEGPIHERLNGAVNGVMQEAMGKEQARTRITLNGYPGVECRFTSTKNGMHYICRVYLVQGRLYQVVAIWAPTMGGGQADAEKFLNSFTLVGVSPFVPKASQSLTEARRNFKSVLQRRPSTPERPPIPPQTVFHLVQYDAPTGKLAAYLTPPDRRVGKKLPAIIWITGGDCNTIGNVWQPAPRSNDQTASAFRQRGIVMMFPSLRGGNTNPGAKEGFLGEVDDVLAAANYLARQPHVDPNRIYLGGHSTGGTLALLVAECSARFRAVFSFGPAADVSGYGPEFLPFQPSPREIKLRSPIWWLSSIRSPVFVFEGVDQGNLDSLQAMARVSKNPKVRFFPVQGANHFNLLAPTNRLIASKIFMDNGPTCNITFTEQEVNANFKK